MKVFLNKIIPDIGMQLLAANNVELILPEEESLSKEDWLNYCKEADVILNVGSNQFDKDFFDACPNVKAISLFSVGYNHVDMAEATKRNIQIGNTPDVLSRATSDTAFLLMQAVARRASFNFQRVKNGEWNNSDPKAFLGQELYGKTLSIYGLGRIGFEMAQKCKAAFGMEILYHNRSSNKAAEQELDARYVSFDELIATADVISIHANYIDEQKELFNADVFKKMKSSSIFINTARGGFHNETDLYHALKTEQIWGAGLDVTNPEPMSENSALLELSTVCVLPHIGSATLEARNGMARIAAENVLAFIRGKRMPHLVNKTIL
jgi:glyoxylate reductase